ncbi:unnamed protein product [Oppiella nova]|uniref:Secreted protein n=1 Tax=Oppiella nova TaxID=334625 RepID=A0A7R9LT69_9ACAR|nr:unnamed protein product [Oppiella nova]CAG2166145.1 unnamed protein product [Oppiella nova]
MSGVSARACCGAIHRLYLIHVVVVSLTPSPPLPSTASTLTPRPSPQWVFSGSATSDRVTSEDSLKVCVLIPIDPK